jgi:hypothetical protein
MDSVGQLLGGAFLAGMTIAIVAGLLRDALGL